MVLVLKISAGAFEWPLVTAIGVDTAENGPSSIRRVICESHAERLLVMSINVVNVCKCLGFAAGEADAVRGEGKGIG